MYPRLGTPDLDRAIKGNHKIGLKDNYGRLTDFLS